MKRIALLFAIASAACNGCTKSTTVSAPPRALSSHLDGVVLPAPSYCGLGSHATYDVRPDSQYTTLGSVPWQSLQAGDTVRVAWRAEPYREKVLLSNRGTSDAEIKLCGLPGPQGQLPVLDGTDATTSANQRWISYVALQDLGVVTVASDATDAWTAAPGYITIESLELRGAKGGVQYTASDGTRRNYTDGAAGLLILGSDHVTVRGCHLTDNGNGMLTISHDDNAAKVVADLLVESNTFDTNGMVGNDRKHNAYLQGIGVTVQFNYFGRPRVGSMGGNLKDRSAGSIVRYNWLDGGQRTIDLVECQEHIHSCQADARYRETFLYGNVIINSRGDAAGPIHYGGDNGDEATYRKGTLYAYHNTLVVTRDAADRSMVYAFDAQSADERIEARNNVLVRNGTTVLALIRHAGTLDLAGPNWVTGGWAVGPSVAGTVLHTDALISGGSPGLDSALLRPLAGSPLLGAAGPLADRVGAIGLWPMSELAPPTGGVIRADARALGALGSLTAQEAPPPVVVPPVPPPTPVPPVEPPPPPVAGGPGCPQCPNCEDPTPPAPPPTPIPPIVAIPPASFPECGLGTTAISIGPGASLQTTVAGAAAGTLIRVAGGTYAPVSWANKALHLCGGWSPDFSVRDPSRYPTTLQGTSSSPVIRLTDVAGSSIVGLTIVGGAGGIELQHASSTGAPVRIAGNIIERNELIGYSNRGGGVFVRAARVDIDRNVIRNNSAGRGGGVAIIRGGTVNLTGNSFEANIGTGDHGGALYLEATDAIVDGNRFEGNEVGVTLGYGVGAGLICFNPTSHCVLKNNVFTGNFAASHGAEFIDEGATAVLDHELLYANRCSRSGGAAIYVDGGYQVTTHATIRNMTVADHACQVTQLGGNGVYSSTLTATTIENSIFWNNVDDFYLSAGAGNPMTMNGVIAQEAWDGAVRVDPAFDANYKPTNLDPRLVGKGAR